MPVPSDVPKKRIEEEVVLINKMPIMRNEESGPNEIRNNAWKADSGASSHMTNDARGLSNMRKIQSKVKIGSGDLREIAKQKNGKETPITLTNVKYVPQLFYNLISLTSVLNKGFMLGMTIKEANTEYMFDQRIKSWDRGLAGIWIERWNTETAGVCKGCTHAILGHPSRYITNLTAKYLALTKTEHDEICESCIRGKQRQKNVTKKVEFRAEKPGDQVYFDISSIQHKSLGGSKFWFLFIDKHTRYKKTYF